MAKREGGARGKDSFVFRGEWFDMVMSLALSDTTNDNAFRVLLAITQYGTGRGDGQTSNPMINAFLTPIFRAIDNDRERYERTCEQNRIKQLKRWEEGKKRAQADTTVYNGIQTYSDNDNDSDNDSDSDNENENDNESESYLNTRPPDFSQIDFSDLFLRQGVADPGEVKKFRDYYEANGWKMKNGLPIVNVEAAVANWCNRIPENSGRTSGDRPREEEKPREKPGHNWQSAADIWSPDVQRRKIRERKWQS